MKFDDDARKDPSAGDMLLGGTAMLHGIGEHTVKDRNAVRGRIFVSATVSCGVWVGGCGVWGVGWGVGCGEGRGEGEVMILRIHLVHHYSSKFGNSQRSLLSPTGGVNTIRPIQQNPMQNGYDENKGYDESYENKCATNYSIITNNNWNDTHSKQLTMHNKYTNDDVDFDECVVHIMR